MTSDMVLGLLERLEQLFEEPPAVPVGFSAEHQNTRWISCGESHVRKMVQHFQ